MRNVDATHFENRGLRALSKDPLWGATPHLPLTEGEILGADLTPRHHPVTLARGWSLPLYGREGSRAF